MRHFQGSLGLVGRIFAILLMALTIEFAVGTFLYERASHLSLQEDEARRLAEHLIISRKLVVERPWHEREAMAEQLTTDRYDVQWSPAPPPPQRLSPELERMRNQIVAWEPSLEKTNLHIRLVSLGRQSTVTGGLKMPDGSWLYFSMKDAPVGWALTAGRMGLALIPAIALLIVSGLLIRRTLTPLRRLAKVTERVGLGERIELEEAGTVEVRNLIRAFNEMQRRIHRLIDDRTETLAAVGHDLRTPIARLQLRLDAIDDDDLRESISGDVAEMGAMVTSLLAYLGGEKDPESVVPIDIAVMAATIVDEMVDQGFDARYAGPGHLEWTLRPVAMRRAISNLVENALHYGKSATLFMEHQQGTLLIRVDDEGPGIPEDRVQDVLKPFVRLDAARRRNTRGLGLGLAIVARAVEREQGALALINRPSGGLRVEIRLPGAPLAG
ncbi:ATP-binding protein [Sphingomonas colocasiae]|uniref:histidine kinase n=1 Tax=Sphingomonas colocasiae TaxID=1848973 RepID=A0ABS7PMK7_9SPHN|nr:ATP-binding protein [Sphingomonas colocasiae]MBY8822534.1 HAMP domain-containing protein [Sphingomonas colocasiae]